MDDQTPGWLPLDRASQRLGISVDALRKRIRRGLVESRRGNDGRVLALVTDQPATGSEMADLDELTEARAEAEHWRSLAEERAVALAAAEATLAERKIVLDELRALLAEARKPWWRKLTGG